MWRQRSIFAISFGVSIAIHVVLLVTARRFVASQGPYKTPDHPTTLPTTRPLDTPLIVTPPPDELIIGQANSAGDANDSTNGDTQTALRALANQASLSRDEQGAESQTPQKPAGQMRGLTIPESADLKGIGAPEGMQRMAIGISALRPGLRGAAPAQDSNDDQTAQGAPQAQQTSPTGESQPSPQPAEVATGQSKPQAETESDLFSETLDVEVRGGRIEARSGRQTKMVRPKLNLAMIADAHSISWPIVVKLRIDVDESGSVRRVTILSSSGGSSMDRAIELAVYSSWIEPAKIDGKPVRRSVTTAYTIYP
ncbi:MAG: TonB family protein [Burkholderiales bacterium]|nr:TonB family protein [Phycisphaerae bacterium]